MELMAKRWHLASVRRVLDVGCGAGHWARQILPRCHPEATLLGIDREPDWIAQAKSLADRANASTRMQFVVGDATNLEAHGGGFDLVTCQTVLIHLANPAAAVEAMVAMLAPGGLCAVAEPNNLANAMVTDSWDETAPMELRISRLRFQFTCEMGKRNLGEGDNSLGERVPEFFARAGLHEIEVYNSDKVALMMPPYASPAERALEDEALEHETRDFASWDRATAEKYFLAGGGTPRDFEAAWRVERERVTAIAGMLRKRTYYACAGGAFYLVSGRKSDA